MQKAPHQGIITDNSGSKYEKQPSDKPYTYQHSL